MKYEIVYSRRGDQDPKRVAADVDGLEAATDFCRNLANFPADTIHYLILEYETGRAVHDTRKDGLL